MKSTIQTINIKTPAVPWLKRKACDKDESTTCFVRPPDNCIDIIVQCRCRVRFANVNSDVQMRSKKC